MVEVDKGDSKKSNDNTDDKKFITVWLLALIVGVFGVDRFYLGKIGTGILKLITIGGLGVWWLIDLILILANRTKDKNGNNLQGYDQGNNKKIALFVTIGVILLALILQSAGGSDHSNSSDSLEKANVNGLTIKQACEDARNIGWKIDVVEGNNDSSETTDCSDTDRKVVQHDYVDSDDSIRLYFANEEEVNSDEDEDSDEQSTSSSSSESSPDSDSVPSTPPSQSTTNSNQPSSSPEPSVSVSKRNAAREAQGYLEYTAFSYTGLVEQLEYEGYPYEDAVYGVDSTGADWNEQAAKSAESYLNYSGFSRQSLIEQLVYEGFTQAQAEHGVNSVGL